MGNFIRHAYNEVEDEIIRRVLTSELPPLAEACQRLEAHFRG